jgi:hypothetical protein
MLIEIKNRAGEIIITGEYGNVKDACEKSKTLRGADLRGAYLTDAYLRGAYLTGADLTGATLWGADLWGADLTGADLWGADLTGADLRGADLTGVEGITLPVITITGSSHSVFYMDGKIIIGCVEKTVAEWILDHEKIGKENKYTDEQIKEYKKYIDMIAMVEKDKT